MKLSFKPDFLLIIILLIIMNIPLLTGTTPIAWDTFKIPYQEFSITYNSIYYHGQLPMWLPDSYYGIPNYFWLSVLSIVDFLFIGIGKLLRIENVLLLFNAALFGEQLISVFGMYLLGTQIFKKRTTILLTCLAFMATFTVYRQVTLSFRLVYLLPLILFWIVLFFKQNSPASLWLAGITLLLSIPGSSFYPLVIEFYAIGIFSLVLLFADLKKSKTIFTRSRKNLLTFVCLLIVAFVFLYYFKTFGDHIEMMREGRGNNLNVPIAIYISTFKSINPLALLGSLLYGVIPYDLSNAYEYIFYIGLPVLVGVIAAALYQRKTVWFATLAAGIFLYAISLRGYFTLAAYFLPFIDITRYISILGMIPFRTFLILAGGFGLDMDLSEAQWTKIGILFLSSFLLLDVFGLATSPLEPVSEVGYMEVIMNPTNYTMDFKFFLIRIAGYLLFILLVILANKYLINTRLSATVLSNIGLVVFIAIDLGLFRYNYETKTQIYLHRSREQVQYLPSLQPLEYQNQRQIESSDNKTLQAETATTLLQSIDGASVNGWITESFLQADRCIPDAVIRTRKFEVFTSNLTPFIENNLVLTSSENMPIKLKQLYGCEYPKLRVVSDLVVSPTDNEAISTVKNTEDFSNLLILSKEHTNENTSLNNPIPVTDIQVVDFSPNNIKAIVNLQQGNGWLIYSDLYHPDWHVTVNGETRNIEQAYLTFKAIPLKEGINSVLFTYGSPSKYYGYFALAIICAIAAFALFCGILAVIFLDLKFLNPSEDKLIDPRV